MKYMLILITLAFMFSGCVVKRKDIFTDKGKCKAKIEFECKCDCKKDSFVKNVSEGLSKVTNIR